MAHSNGVLYVRAIETAAGPWRCRLGMTEFDEHDELVDALIHLRMIGEREAVTMPFEIVVHPLEARPWFLRGDAIASIDLT